MSRPRRAASPHAPHFGYTHPLSEAALRRCRREHPQYRSGKNKVACGRCWEVVIRADAVLAAETRLPQSPPRPDPELIDEVAIERAVAGEAPIPHLTPLERDVAVRQLRRQEMTFAEIASHLGITKYLVSQALDSKRSSRQTVLNLAA